MYGEYKEYNPMVGKQIDCVPVKEYKEYIICEHQEFNTKVWLL